MFYMPAVGVICTCVVKLTYGANHVPLATKRSLLSLMGSISMAAALHILLLLPLLQFGMWVRLGFYLRGYLGGRFLPGQGEVPTVEWLGVGFTWVGAGCHHAGVRVDT